MQDFEPALVRRLSARTEPPFPDAEKELSSERAARRCWNNELTDCQRRYLLHYYRDCMTMRAIAAEYGVNVSTVSRTLRRARNRLRRILQYYYAEERADQ